MGYDMKPNINDVAARISSKRVALTPSVEGGYAADGVSLIKTLMSILVCKYGIDNAYRSLADRIRGPFRDAVVEHWHEHAKEERQAAYDIAMKVVGLGGDPVITTVTTPDCGPDLGEFIQLLVNLELDLISKERQLIEESGDNTSMKVLGENLVLVDTQHLDDLRRMSYQYVG